MSDTSSEETDRPMFKIGDVVTLKSGGPDMTISRVSKKGEISEELQHVLYCVIWFNESGESLSDEFLEPMLKKSSEPKASGYKG